MPLSRFPGRALSLAAGIALCGCSSDAGPAEERAVPVLARGGLRRAAVGCWQLVDSRGRSASDRIAWAPAIVQLDSAEQSPQSAFPRQRIARRFDPAWRPLPTGFEPGIDGAMTWRADSLTDSVRVEFNNGFFGSVFVLAVPDGRRLDTLHGRAFEFSDVVPDDSPDHGSVAAVRVRCSAP
jgi:hypothetical protein